MRRGAVNILRRTCWRNGNNLFAASRRRTSASAITRFTRLLSCPCGRFSRHLFGFFFLFFFSAEKSMFLSLLSVLGPGACFLGLRFLGGFHLENKLRGHSVMQSDRDLVLAGICDGALEDNFVPVNLGAELVFAPVHDVRRGDGSKCFASLAGLEREDEPRFTDSARQLFCLI